MYMFIINLYNHVYMHEQVFVDIYMYMYIHVCKDVTNDVITVGVTKRYRRHGVGRHLMTSLLDHVTSNLSNCWAVYLHVVSTNTSAIGQSLRLTHCTCTCVLQQHVFHTEGGGGEWGGIPKPPPHPSFDTAYWKWNILISYWCKQHPQRCLHKLLTPPPQQ